MYAMHNREKPPLANLTIRNLEPAIKERLQLRATRHGYFDGARSVLYLT